MFPFLISLKNPRMTQKYLAVKLTMKKQFWKDQENIPSEPNSSRIQGQVGSIIVDWILTQRVVHFGYGEKFQGKHQQLFGSFIWYLNGT